MTDEQKDDKGTENKTASEAKQAPPQPNGFNFPAVMNGQYLRDLSFENPHAPLSIISARSKPEVSVEFNMDYRKLDSIPEAEGDMYEVLLKVRVVAKSGDQTAFVVDIEHGTSCTITGLADEHIEPFLLTEVPHFAFPFVRQIVADVTAQGGFKPLYLAPVNFPVLYQQRLQSQGKVKKSA